MSEILLDATLNRNDKYKAQNVGIYNIVKDYDWTATPTNNRHDVPYIVLTEYEQDLANIWASLYYWGNQLKVEGLGNVDSPYEGLYSMTPTGTVFTIPYFETYDHGTTQNWNQNRAILSFPIADIIGATIEKFSIATQQTVGTNVNSPRIWEGSTPNTYMITFHLFNTIAKDSVEKNKKLKRRLQMSALHNQKNIMYITPPAIFTVNIPGIRYSPAAVISNLTTTNVGQMNLIDGENIPDAYSIAITITELVTESRQIFDAAVTGDFSKVSVQTDVGKDIEKAENGLKAGVNNNNSITMMPS